LRVPAPVRTGPVPGGGFIVPLTDLRQTMLRTRYAHRSANGLLLSGVVAVLLVAGCGSPEETPTPAAGTAGEAPTATVERAAGDLSVIVRPDRVYTIDDVVAAGWKKSKQFSTETVPQSTDIWYGFFSRKDIEVRVYASHADALEHGVAPAEEAVARIGQQGGGGGAGLLDFGGASIAKYQAYAVAGNLVMLCETELAVCEGLIEQMD